MSGNTIDDKALLELKVIRKKIEAIDICSLELAAIDGGLLPEFSAGSHIDVYLPGGIIRQYSLCSDSNNRQMYKIAILKDPASRGGSLAVHDLVQEGQTVKVSHPKNHFSMATDAQKSLLVAGGIGITPILSMAEHLASQNAEFELHYVARTPDHAAFLDDIRNSQFAHRVQFYFSRDPQSAALDLKKILSNPAAACHLYICGPQKLIDATLSIARELGWPESQLHYELFGAEIVKSDTDAGFDVGIASSGRVIHVPQDQTVVQALAAAGIDILMSCEQGVCGTCLTGVLEGIPDHKDSYLTPEEQAANNIFTPCCSRSKTAKLVLDL